jgi:predicted transcriptional regulator
MRTTIEIKSEHRARLLELAATRGEKGFSNVVNEALDLYLQTQTGRNAAIKKALALKGTMSAAEAKNLESETRKIRDNWR